MAHVQAAPPPLLQSPPDEEQMRPNGKVAKSSSCECCPYGYHIDRDFVQYAEDVASGNYMRHLRQVRKAKRKMRKSMEMFLNQHQQRRPENGEAGGGRRSFYENVKMEQAKADHPPGPFSPMSERSGAISPLFSDSLEDLVSDFEETYSSTGYGGDEPAGKYRDYSSDYEVVARANRSAPDGYASDYGYAVPLQRRSNGSAGPSASKIPYRPANSLPGRISNSMPKKSPYADDSSHYAPATPPNADLSESFSSVSSSIQSDSRKSSTTLNAEYRGLSGQIAENLERVAQTLNSPANRTISSLKCRDPQVQVMRQQIDISLAHMRDLEDQVARIPMLNDRIQDLKQERQRLMSQLETEKQRLIRERHQQVNGEFAGERNNNFVSSPPPTIGGRSASMVSFADSPPSVGMQITRVLKERVQQQTISSSSINFTQQPAAIPAVVAGKPPPVPLRSASLHRLKAISSSSTRSSPGTCLSPNSSQSPAKPLLAYARTPSGRTLNVDGFHSMHRGYRQNVLGGGVTRAATKRFSGSLKREDDYVSDSELALGDRYNSIATANAQSLRQTQSQRGGPMDILSDTEDYVQSKYERVSGVEGLERTKIMQYYRYDYCCPHHNQSKVTLHIFQII